MAHRGGRWALIVHGGAKEIAPEKEKANRDGCLAALSAGAAMLREGGSALEAVEASIRVLEDDPTFNAGRGSVRNSDGEVEMDAALMDGAALDVGGVAAIRGVRHPITVARLMLREPPTLLVAEGARRFAEAHGAETCDPADLLLAVEDTGHDTVGCVALDVMGNLAAGTSTGGLEGSPPGRVGDSPVPGCGLYADNSVGAVAFSGDGESIVRRTLAARVMQLLESGPPQAAIEATLDRLGDVGGEAGGIVLDRKGQIGWAHNSSHFAAGIMTSEDERSRIYLRKDEEAAHD
ncbi:isoaspartyl peptidase/L-asparaginase family protein [Roseomonas chloroacetimidivorans]|uniref:isoaspartyl peptidase/L-asparaginase family protein n=1 Tax=Roseomonas chloroacetimidivorans TaxID=1766656 RepID=UPI003C77C3A8